MDTPRGRSLPTRVSERVQGMKRAESGQLSHLVRPTSFDPAPMAKKGRPAKGVKAEAPVESPGLPELIDAWAIDRDLEHPTSKSLEVRVLLTKNQLSDLQSALKEIVQVGIATETSRSQFFDQLRSAAATLSRDPTKVGHAGATNLKEMGLLGEYLDDLPYRSRVLSLSEEAWNRWTIGEQVAFMDDLEAKIRLYQSFHDDTDAWVTLDKGAAPGDAVYPVPLSALP